VRAGATGSFAPVTGLVAGIAFCGVGGRVVNRDGEAFFSEGWVRGGIAVGAGLDTVAGLVGIGDFTGAVGFTGVEGFATVGAFAGSGGFTGITGLATVGDFTGPVGLSEGGAFPEEVPDLLGGGAMGGPRCGPLAAGFDGWDGVLLWGALRAGADPLAGGSAGRLVSLGG
jgi:hypothetical protein